jgi:iron complex outermembrane receptor protein
VFAEAGQFRERDVRASLSHVAGAVSADAAVARQDNDNYRANSDFTRTASRRRAGGYAGGRAGLRVESARQDSRLPGSLTLAQFEADPTQTQTPNDFGARHRPRQRLCRIPPGRGRPGGRAVAPRTRRRVELLLRLQRLGDAYEGRQNQFSPRARWLGDGGGMLNELVAGVDVNDWKRKTTSDYSLADASQKSKAFYLRDELRFDPAHDGRVALGVRREIFDKDYVDAMLGGAPDNGSQAQNAWEAQGSYRVLPQLELTARAGRATAWRTSTRTASAPA